MKINQLKFLIVFALIGTGCQSNKESADRTVYIYDDFDKNNFQNEESYLNHLNGIEKVKENELLDAKQYFELALQSDPDNDIIMNSLAITESRLENYNRAIEILEKVISKNPRFYDSYINLTQTYRLNGQLEKAIECADNLIKQNPNRRAAMGAWYNKSFVELEWERYDSSLNSIEMAIKLCDNTKDLEKFNDVKSIITERISREQDLKKLLE